MIGHLYPVLLAGAASEPPDPADMARETLGGRGRKAIDHDTHGAAAAVLAIVALVASGELDE